MKDEQIRLFALAFRELDAFSLPGIGCFRRIVIPAHFDPNTGQLFPPSESIDLTNESPEEFEAFIEHCALISNISKDSARNVALEIANGVKKEVETEGLFIIPRIGKLKKSFQGYFQLELDSDDPTLRSFGLPIVDAPLAESSKQRTSKPKSRAEQAPVEREKSTKLLVGLVASVAFLLVVMLIFGMFYRSKISKWLGISPEKIIIEHKTVETSKDPVQEIKKAIADSTTLRPINTDTSTSRTNAKPKEKEPLPLYTGKDTLYCILVDHAEKGDDDARKKIKYWQQKGFTPKLLKGRIPNTYRIIIGENKSQAYVDSILSVLKSKDVVNLDAFVTKTR